MNYEDELQHYGIPGQKWGVRRNLRVLANHRRNVAVNNAKREYRNKNITKDQRKLAIKQANLDKKALLKSVKQKRTREEFKQYKKDIKKQTLSEVPNARIKKGATTVNHLITAAQVAGAGAAIGTAAVMGLPVLAAAGGAGAASIAVSVGKDYCIQKGILDNLA